MANLIHPLGSGDVSRAYVAVERAMPSLDLKQWAALTASAALRRRWLVAKDHNGYIRGISYMIVKAERTGQRRLEIPLIASLSLTEGRDTVTRFLSAARALAIEKSCQSLHVWTAVPPDWSVLEEYLERSSVDHGVILGVNSELVTDHSIFPVKM